MDRPPNADELESIIADAVKEEVEKAGLSRTHEVDWKDEKKIVPVIRMKTSLLRLNPDTQRIKAQLGASPKLEALLGDQPYSDEAQEYLSTLLKGDPTNPVKVDKAYEALEDNLREYQQNEPGIITSYGVLIDGNTRCVALRAIDQEYMLVGVLPSGGTEDFELLEIGLSARKTTKRDYTFVNQLLAIRNQTAAGRNDDQIVRSFARKKKTIARFRWILERIDAVLQRSEVTGASGSSLKLAYVDFEQHQESLVEIARNYFELEATDANDAELLAEQRILALLFDLAKTDLRFIEPNFLTEFAPGLVPDSEGGNGEGTTVPGLNISIPGSSNEVHAMKDFATAVFKAKATINNAEDMTIDDVAAAGKLVESVRTALDKAVINAGKNATYKQRKFAPAERIADAAELVRLAKSSIADAKAESSFDPDDLDEPLSSLRDAVRDLGAVLKDHLGGVENGDGLDWLSRVLSVDDPDA